MRTYVFNDLLKRVLMYNNYKLKHVINVTDVGHLTSDEDTGDDKVEKAAKEEGRTAKEITDYYFGKLAKLNIKNLEEGKRIDIKEKKNKTDFALWKFSENPGIRQQEWDPKKYGLNSGIGFPGWHIECSAMS